MSPSLTRRSRAQAPAESERSGAAPADGHRVVLDPGALARLSELDPRGENRLLERVLQAFQTSAARLRPQADAARLSGDRDVIKRVAHTLKSSAASIGSLRLAGLCAEIESGIREQADAPLDPQLDALVTALDETLQAIARMLKDMR